MDRYYEAQAESDPNARYHGLASLVVNIGILLLTIAPIALVAGAIYWLVY